MAISPALPIAGKSVVALLQVQWSAMAQRADDHPELGHIFAALSLPLHILLELGGPYRF